MIESVRKAMKILSVISDAAGGALTLAEISERTGYPKPTCAHITKTLAEEGYVLRISHTVGYTLGPGAYYLTRYGRYEEKLISICRPVMRYMERKSGAAVILSVIKNSDKFIIDTYDTSQNMFKKRAQIRIDDIYRTATGRAILAEMSDEDAIAVYKKHGPPPRGHWDEVDGIESLLSELKNIRKQKIVITGRHGSKNDRPALGIARAIFDKKHCVGAVGLAVWDEGIGDEELEKLRAILIRGAAEIQRRLTFENNL